MQNNIQTIYFIRHGRTYQNINKIIQGRMDNKLTATGIDDANLVGNKLEETNVFFDCVISSPLSRAMDTARIVCNHLVKNNQLDKDFKIIENIDFIERDFGEAEGKDINEENYERILNDDWPNMETKKELCKRTKEGFLKILQNYPNKTILVICHSHVIKSLFMQYDQNVKFNSKFGHHSLNWFKFTNGACTECNFNKK